MNLLIITVTLYMAVKYQIFESVLTNKLRLDTTLWLCISKVLDFCAKINVLVYLITENRKFTTSPSLLL